jgi:hypothetical protein
MKRHNTLVQIGLIVFLVTVFGPFILLPIIQVLFTVIALLGGTPPEIGLAALPVYFYSQYVGSFIASIISGIALAQTKVKHQKGKTIAWLTIICSVLWICLQLYLTRYTDLFPWAG